MYFAVSLLNSVILYVPVVRYDVQRCDVLDLFSSDIHDLNNLSLRSIMSRARYFDTVVIMDSTEW